MNAPDQSLDAAATVDGADDNLHYLRAVIDMADRCVVTTQEAIYTDKGIKLVDKGARVDSRLYDRLVRHRLRGSIDGHLDVQDMVAVPSIVQAAAAQCQTDTLAYLLVHALQDEQAENLLGPVRAMLLPHALAFKLTVMREQHPVLFAHSVRMMLTAVYLGLKSGWTPRECVPLAAAALLHDIGELHLDPVWRDPACKVTGAGRSHLMTHPITAMLAVRAQNVYPRSVEQAILEHHECMDGSGYPRGLRGEQISPMGQILMVAEVAAAFFEKYANEAAAQRLSLMLRLYHRKFPPALAAHLLPLLQIKAVQTPLDATQDEVERAIGLLSDAFDDWQALRACLPPEALAPGSDRACAFAEQRLAGLEKTLYEAGSHPRQQAGALHCLAGDAQGLAELSLLGREALWQLQNIVDATHTRWPRLQASVDAGDAAVCRWRDACADRLAPP